MTLALTDGREEYAGNGVTTLFSFPHYFLQDEDLVVIERVVATGVETVKTLTTHYTVSGEGEPSGGSVTMLVAPPTGTNLIIYRDPSPVQELNYEDNHAQPAASQERALDLQMMIAQRQANRIDRSVRLSEGFSSAFDPTLPAVLEAGQSIIVNEDADGFEAGPTAEDIADAEANALAAAASAAAAALSETAADGFADAAAASAASAVAALNSAFFRDVVYKTSADSPVTVAQADNGKLFSIDASGGPVTINLPQISGLALPFNVAIALGVAGNTVTIDRGGSDTFVGGATSKTLTAAGTGIQATADTDMSPDNWATLDFGTIADNAVTTAKIVDSNVTLAKLAAAVQALLVPTGVVAPFAGSSVPTGWLFCNGAAISRTTYAALFAAIGSAYGSGDGSTTFNLPDLQGQVLRGRMPIANVTGSGSASSNNGTFTAHGYSRTGTRVRMASGTLSGLSTSTNYYLIVVDANTLAFASSKANALAGTKIALSGANSAVIQQWEDPDASSRTAMNTGGNTGTGVGSMQDDELLSHDHAQLGPNNSGGSPSSPYDYHASLLQTFYPTRRTDVTGGNETRPRNVYVNYIIKT